MDRKNLDAIMKVYVERFDELNKRDGNDEGYKWRAESCFKKHWDIEAEDFASMFKLSMKETSNLIDNATVQPIGGILELLKHSNEVEFVRTCFRELFSEDNGDLKNRQTRIEIFADKINERLDHYVHGSWKYPQKINNVIYYLNLWKPEENYIFKSTEATAWANCIEYGDDFGSGSTFSLAKYYKMCDELLSEFSKYDEVMRLHNERVAKEMPDYDDKLHILVYDIIYCAHAYNFYNGIIIQNVSTKERIKNAHLRNERDELQQQIAEKETQLQDLNDNPVILPNVAGYCLQHKKYGEGIVISCKNNMLLLDFSGEQKKFPYPSSITQEFLRCADDSIIEKIKAVDIFEKQRTALGKEIAVLKSQLEKLK